MSKLGSTVIAVSFFLVLTSCASVRHEPFKSNSKAITVMAYNVENLFDTKDDPGKNDEEFLPLNKKQSPRLQAKCRLVQVERYQKACLYHNWDESMLKRKMQRLANVILQVKQGRGPDVLIVEEVENLEVLKRLNRSYLSAAGYSTVVLLEGPDKRGIDVGILSRLPQVGKARLHSVAGEREAEAAGKPKFVLKPTRGILQVDLKLPDNQLLTVLGLHFPSPRAPTEARLIAIDTLNKIKASLPDDRLVVAGGDFNISTEEDVQSKLYSELIAKNWDVSHLVGCSDCRGTHYYHGKRSWSFLDAILFSKSMTPEGDGKWYAQASSVRIPNNSLYQRNRYGSPQRFGRGDRKNGVSDHWPIAIDLRPKQSVKQSQARGGH